MPFAPVNGIELYYEERGQGEPLVLAHGAGGNHESWEQQLPAFGARYRVITFDHRAFGQSRDVNGLGAAAFVDDLRGLMEHLGIERFLLVGQSMGGFTSLAFARAYPERVRALVLADTTGGLHYEDPVLLRLMDDNRPADFALTRNPVGVVYRTRNPQGAARYVAIAGRNPPRSGAFLDAFPMPRGALPPAEFHVPTLCIVGSLDAIFPPTSIEYVAAQLPDSRLVEVPECGHSVYFENPAAFNRLVLEFFAGREPA
ncbi:MAG: alpha/beta hydrolase [Chloroflexi bacterium]|nr:alpha/beta hydrolase [Chloroflexota bacterium]